MDRVTDSRNDFTSAGVPVQHILADRHEGVLYQACCAYPYSRLDDYRGYSGGIAGVQFEHQDPALMPWQSTLSIKEVFDAVAQGTNGFVDAGQEADRAPALIDQVGATVKPVRRRFSTSTTPVRRIAASNWRNAHLDERGFASYHSVKLDDLSFPAHRRRGSDQHDQTRA